MSQIFKEKCADCGKEFIYDTIAFYHFHAAKTDCLNNSRHNYCPVNSDATNVPSEWIGSDDAIIAAGFVKVKYF